jgi:hypothetical protein
MLSKLGAVEIDAHLDTAIGGTRERLHDWPVRQDIGGHVDFMLGAINQCNDMFEVFAGQRKINELEVYRAF